MDQHSFAYTTNDQPSLFEYGSKYFTLNLDVGLTLVNMSDWSRLAVIPSVKPKDNGNVSLELIFTSLW